MGSKLLGARKKSQVKVLAVAYLSLKLNTFPKDKLGFPEINSALQVDDITNSVSHQR